MPDPQAASTGTRVKETQGGPYFTLRQAGGSVTATLPKDMADRLHVKPGDKGDKVYAIETERGVLLTPYDPAFDEALQAFEDVRRQYRNALKRLAE